MKLTFPFFRTLTAFWLIGFLLAGCNLLAEPTMTPTSMPTAIPTTAATATDEPTPTVSATATVTATVTLTSTITASPTVTDVPTVTPTPSITPAALPVFRSDELNLITLPDNIRDGIDNALIVFTNSNDQTTIANIATAQPENT